MKYLIGSDIHGSSESCKKMLEWYEEYHCERMILLGDYLYHGPRNDIPGAYDVKSVAEMLNKYASVIYAVHGNCDSDVDQMMFEFPIQAEYLLLSE